MKLKILTFIIIITLPLFFLSCAPKEENLLEPQGPSEIIPAEIKNNPNVIYNSQNSNSEQKEKPLADSYCITMNCVFQNPELPTGCEITALTTVLNHLGYDVTKTEMARDYLKKDYLGRVGFDKAFIGNPESDSGYGCFAPVIVDAALAYLNEHDMKYSAWDISGKELNELFEYVNNDIPVIVWASMGLMEVYKKPAFVDAEGNQIYWYDNEHCVVLCGYDLEKQTVTVCDPISGIVDYGMERFQYIYDQLEKQAVIVQ